VHTAASDAIEELYSVVKGWVVVPGDTDYDRARTVS